MSAEFGAAVERLRSPILLATATAALAGIIAMSLFARRKALNVVGKHVIITGGSQGLGLSIANMMAARGAHVTIMARTVSKLELAVKEIEGHRQDSSQRIQYISADLRSFDTTDAAFSDACKAFDGAAPDLVFAVSGGAAGAYGFLAETTTERLQDGFATNYLTTLWTTRAAATRMAKQSVKGRIVLVSSVMGFLGFVGAAGYAPAKAAIRSLAECLRNEFILYDMKIHCYFPGGIDSPGYVSEQEGKPPISVAIEGNDTIQSPDVCAKKLIKGIEREQFFITSDFVGDLFRANVAGVAPRSSFFQDLALGIIGPLAFPIWRRIIDRQVRNSSQDHLARIRGQ